MAKFTSIEQLRKASKTVTLERGAEELEIEVWPLTAKEMDTIRSAFVPPPAPMIERGGETVPDVGNEQYQREVAAVNLRRTFAMAGAMIGLDAIGAESFDDAADKMAANFYESEIDAILTAGINPRTLTNADVKGAAHGVAPFGS